MATQGVAFVQKVGKHLVLIGAPNQWPYKLPSVFGGVKLDAPIYGHFEGFPGMGPHKNSALLGGGFKHFLFSPIPGKMIQID